MDSKQIHLIEVHDPVGTKYDPGPRTYIAYNKGAFTSKEVAEEVINGMRMFQEKGDETTFRVRSYKLDESDNFEQWMDNNAPWRQKAV